MGLGCHAVEVDVCVSRDNKLVVMHDLELSPDFVRDIDGGWLEPGIRVRDLTAMQLQELEIGKLRPGSLYAIRFSGQASLDQVGIPLLDEYIDIVIGVPDVTLNIELKGAPVNPDLVPSVDEYADLVASVFEQRNIAQRTFLQSFDWRLPLAVRDRVPDLKIGLTSDLQDDGDPQGPLPGTATPWQCGKDVRDYGDIPTMVKSLGADVWSSNHLDVDQALVKSAHDQGLEVYVWTVNREQHIRRMVGLGVDAITTDYPDKALELVRSLKS